MTTNFIIGNTTIDSATPVETVVLIAQGQVEFWKKRCERMERALRPFAGLFEHLPTDWETDDYPKRDVFELQFSDIARARQALSEEPQ